ncbi:dihydroorotate dehydrogenase-like protein [Anabaena cylindrica FACHB-243]|uniref:Dihydroorotate oxidase n=1 Tax=Anabaena cylindrica (strain ATCC 27899 / PCC 7122) TaxID=272123 RepID=K9ZLB4_ANACC|nr:MULTISPECIES: dihydroorotate dehydrogenase-like protein [Anabaena]AFZ59574.1 dihydroorotate oxidase [Anabaena cylindrica PCC 7122]MBD2418761.1 dihydroorotate dehydrogenase-like protein [Anabaena cylindrica FACHB-243]MBY5282436.1 dihydroorotate dehydrogenase-like protein [Anabaena sp. CCAP 1446/1C]MBY5310830.1 dihydroorotate dehydrogenase-like protein [Anabaena sp. CCAP 1446/1C]MCM2406326.1 dihydroorotate dehydrogenase-like protein [Anabaena sp. CCAP 1446/1C]
MNLTTTYLGLELKSPLVPSASPLSQEIDNIKLMEDAGAGAVVMHSLFEEQLILEKYELHHHLTHGTESFAEALTYFPDITNFRIGPEEYLDHIRKAKEKVDIPIIASLNGFSVGGWTEYGKLIQEAGASALELNIYYVPTDPDLISQDIEQNYINILSAVKAAVTIPVAVKLSPYFTNTANMAKRLDDAGADGLVLFNRFYQPDINLETLEVEPHVLLSTPQAMRLPLRWIAILYGRINADLAATSGIHNAHDVLKMLMVGSNITMLCSVLMRHGIDHIRCIEQEMREWMEKHEYESVRQMQGSMSQLNCPNPSSFERAQYMRSLQTYNPEWGRIYIPS